MDFVVVETMVAHFGEVAELNNDDGIHGVLAKSFCTGIQC